MNETIANIFHSFRKRATSQPDEEPELQLQSRLLQLPLDIRQRIYDHIDIPQAHIFRLNKILNHMYRRDDISHRPSSIHSLLLSCKLLYREVRNILYSNNHFMVKTNDYGDLDILRRLRPGTIAQLTMLTIEPRTKCCPEGYECIAKREDDPMSPRSQLPITWSENYMVTEKKILREWHNLWYEHLKPNLTPGRTEIQFIFDSSSLNMARAASKPFWDGPPAFLKSCTMRLSDTPDRNIRQLAMLAVNKATPSSAYRETSMKGFRFMDLPQELRDHILMFTDLITPERAVWWSPATKTKPVRTAIDIDATSWHESAAQPDTNLSCTERTSPIGCFCASVHSAYTSIRSIECRCWAPPTALFMVSRAMRQEAMHIFYNYNELRLVPQASRWYNFEFTEGDLPATVFLRACVPRDGLQYLRKLEIVFPPWLPAFPETCFDKSTKTWARWNDCIQAFKKTPALHNLTLRVVFATAYDDDNVHNEHEAVLEQYQERITALDGLYYDAVSPLRDLPGLQHLIIELPCFRTPVGTLVEAGQALARQVMGDDYIGLPQRPRRRE